MKQNVTLALLLIIVVATCKWFGFAVAFETLTVVAFVPLLLHDYAKNPRTYDRHPAAVKSRVATIRTSTSCKNNLQGATF